MHKARMLIAALAALVGSVGLGGSATASSTTAFHAIFIESGCAPLTVCGSGNVAGVGHVESSVFLPIGCGPGCSLRTITFTDGSTLVTQGVTTGITLPGRSDDAQSVGDPVWITGAWTIVGGTGVFAGATGSGTGRIHVAGALATTRLVGTITLS